MDKRILTIALAKHLGRGDFSLSGNDVDSYTLHFADGTTTQGTDYDLAAIYVAEEVVQNKGKRITELKRFLVETDYVVLSDYDQDKPELKAQRQAWRQEIRTLEQQS